MPLFYGASEMFLSPRKTPLRIFSCQSIFRPFSPSSRAVERGVFLQREPVRRLGDEAVQGFAPLTRERSPGVQIAGAAQRLRVRHRAPHLVRLLQVLPTPARPPAPRVLRALATEHELAARRPARALRPRVGQRLRRRQIGQI